MDKRYTLQEVFDRATQHLLTTNKRCENAYGQCLYRGPFADRCVIGALIEDQFYSPEYEGTPVDTFPSDTHPALVESLEKSGIQYRSDIRVRGLLYQLQILHDHLPPDMWEGGLEAIAEQFRLRFNPPAATCQAEGAYA